MATIEEITASGRPIEDTIKDLKQKSVIIPAWTDLEKQYYPKNHPVTDKNAYPDKVQDSETIKMCRITFGFQRLAAKRMTEFSFGIPVKRIYSALTPGEQEVARVMEKIFQRSRIDSRNIERGNMLFAGCEIVTLWYATEEVNTLYGVESKIKLRCKNYSPMNGDTLYPLFDEYDDMTALSFGHIRTQGDIKTEYFDIYTANQHIQFTKGDGDWIESLREAITLMKIPGVYVSRPTPIWEDLSDNVYEIEWTLSRNGNYIRKNSKPNFVISSDEPMIFGAEKSSDDKLIMQVEKGGSAKYETWDQAIDAIKFQNESIKNGLFADTQIPDISFEAMKLLGLSGTAMDRLFIDAHLKVKDESGRWLEAFDREVNIIKAFLKVVMPGKDADIDSLQVESVITPFTISDDKDTIQNLSTAIGGKSLMSQKTAIKYLGWADDVGAEILLIQAEEMASITEPTN